MNSLTHSVCKSIVIAGLLAVSAGAQAEILASMPNQSGGEILLTSSLCGTNGLRVFTTASGGLVSGDGCASALGDNRIGIAWSDGDYSVMPDEWILTTAGKQLTGVPAKAPPSRTAKHNM